MDKEEQRNTRVERLGKLEDAVKLMEAIQKSYSASYWLKENLRIVWERDPVDALKDAKTLAHILKLKVQYLTGVKE